MNKQQLEFKALTIIDAVKLGHTVEDTTVELKRDWVDVAKMARQIAGHANAARGQRILWLIGVDETDGVTGAAPMELADWIPQIRACFDDQLSPQLIDHASLNVDGKQVVLLYFETDRAPYVTKTSGAGNVHCEVPWREGNSTRSARRHDLLRLLVPKATIPILELQNAELGYWRGKDNKEKWELRATIYATNIDDATVFFPRHKCECLLKFADDRSPLSLPVSFDNEEAPGVICYSSQVAIVQSGQFRMSADLARTIDVLSIPQEVSAQLRFTTASSDAPDACISMCLSDPRPTNNRDHEHWWTWKPT